MKRRTLTNKDKIEIGTKCCNCGCTHDLQYHHIIPLAIGGQDINSNMCCLCYDCHYKLHHDGKESKINNFSKLVRRGQARAKKKGVTIGRTGNEITIIMTNGIIYKGNSAKMSKIFNKDQRTIELWTHGNISDKTKKKIGIKYIFISKLHHNQTSSKVIINKKNMNASNQLAFFLMPFYI